MKLLFPVPHAKNKTYSKASNTPLLTSLYYYIYIYAIAALVHLLFPLSVTSFLGSESTICKTIVLFQVIAMDMKQANDLEFFKGLSDPCPAIFEKTLKQVCEDPFSGSAICISGWQSIGNERILKYVARRALVELKLVD
ncbi:hypothetical protein FRX31_032381, partial [Thalictrum thalictroides]